MQGIIDNLLNYSPSFWPRYFERSHRTQKPLREHFESRLAKASAYLGIPKLEKTLAWFPAASLAATWNRDDRTLALILERNESAILLCCVSNIERNILLEASKSRDERVRSVEFPFLFDELLRNSIATGADRSLRFRLLLDELAVIPEKARVLLDVKLRDPDGEIRCGAADASLNLFGIDGVKSMLQLIDDSLEWVRWHVIGLLSNYGDDSVVQPLIRKLSSDRAPGVRGQAAFALGHIGSPEAIPYLIHAMDHDKENDSLGHSPSSISATSLDNILGTNETRIRHEDGLCSLAKKWPPDYELLKSQATQIFEKWQQEHTRSQ